MINRVYLFFSFLTCLTSCEWLESPPPQDAMVKVGEHVLHKADLMRVLPEQYSPEDSVRLIEAYIDQWSVQKLLYDQAILNLEQQEQSRLLQLVDSYKQELYTTAYLDTMTRQKMDTTVTAASIEDYFASQSDQFKLNEDLVRCAYIYLPLNYPKKDQIIQDLFTEDPLALHRLDSLKLSFKDYYLADSVWSKSRDLFTKIKPLQERYPNMQLPQKQKTQLADSLGVYLLHIKEVRNRGQKTPLPYIKPVIKQILLNKQKLEYITQLEKDLLNDAKRKNKITLQSAD